MKEVITTVRVTDDMTGEVVPEEQTETVTWSWRGNTYEIDLAKTTIDAVEADELQTLIRRSRRQQAAGRKPVGRPPGSGEFLWQRGQAPAVYNTTSCRAWLEAHGYELPPKGKRMPASLVQHYRDAFPDMK